MQRSRPLRCKLIRSGPFQLFITIISIIHSRPVELFRQDRIKYLSSSLPPPSLYLPFSDQSHSDSTTQITKGALSIHWHCPIESFALVIKFALYRIEIVNIPYIPYIPNIYYIYIPSICHIWDLPEMQKVI